MKKNPIILRWENAPDFLKPQEAAQLLRVGKNKIYEMATRQGFPKLFIGEKHFLIPREALYQWVSNQISGVSGEEVVNS